MVKLRVALFASTPKDSEQPALNEDAWLADEAGQRWALADGASESYDSRVWARMLVQRYVQDSGVGPDWIGSAVAEYNSSVDIASLSWSKQAAFERGSFATLLGVELAPNGTDMEVLAIGDSLAVHVRGSTLIASYPYRMAEEFDSRPQLLATIAAANRFIREPDFITRNSSRTWAIEPGDFVYLMTDAVGQWMLTELSDEPSSLATLEGVADEVDFNALVTQLRQERRIRLDDSTVVRLVAEAH